MDQTPPVNTQVKLPDAPQKGRRRRKDMERENIHVIQSLLNAFEQTTTTTQSLEKRKGEDL